VDRIFDLAIVGGGVNGCGKIARDWGGRAAETLFSFVNDVLGDWTVVLGPHQARARGGLRSLE